MFPIVLNVSDLNLLLIGDGPATERRRKSLEESGTKQITWRKEMPVDEELEGVTVAFVGDFDDAESQEIANKLKAKGILVNVEDKTELCDFHVPAMVRRGDLLLTVSTGGKSPRLARRIRKDLEHQYGEEWREQLDRIAAERLKWKDNGASFNEIAEKTDMLLEKEGWL